MRAINDEKNSWSWTTLVEGLLYLEGVFINTYNTERLGPKIIA
jgi:hypothetical protein